MIYDEQVRATNAICDVTLFMFEYGAKSILVEQTSQRLGKALRIDSVELALLSSAIVITTFTNSQTQTVSISRRARDKPINMSMICDIQNLVKTFENSPSTIDILVERIKNIQVKTYNRWLVIFMVGVSCGCFSHLHGGDFGACLVTFSVAAFGVLSDRNYRERGSAHLPFFL